MVKIDIMDCCEYPSEEYIIMKLCEFDERLKNISFNYFDDFMMIKGEIMFYRNCRPQPKLYLDVKLNDNNEIVKIDIYNEDEIPKSDSSYYEYCKKTIEDCIERDIQLGTITEEYEKLISK